MKGVKKKCKRRKNFLIVNDKEFVVAIPLSEVLPCRNNGFGAKIV